MVVGMQGSTRKPLPSRRAFVGQMARSAGMVALVVAVSLGIGAAGYHGFEGLPWLDATLNASMILTGMGPVTPLATTPGKLFGIGYSLFSGVVFLTMVAVLLSPGAKRLLHGLHLELTDENQPNP